MTYKDKEKGLAYKKLWNKQYYKKNKVLEKARIYKRKHEIKQWLIDYRSNLECKYCGEKTTVCLDFHHINQSKKDLSVALASRNGWGRERIEKEIKKCIVLCSNCHRKLHAGLISLN